MPRLQSQWAGYCWGRSFHNGTIGEHHTHYYSSEIVLLARATSIKNLRGLTDCCRIRVSEFGDDLYRAGLAFALAIRSLDPTTLTSIAVNALRLEKGVEACRSLASCMLLRRI